MNTKEAGNDMANEKGVLVLKQIEFDQVYKRKVSKNNDTSGKVTLPRELIGKTVYVVVVENETDQGEQKQ